MDTENLRKIVEAAILAAGEPVSMARLESLFDEGERPEREEFQAALEDIEADCCDRGYELRQTASGYRFQVRHSLARWISRLWEEKPKKYTRALLETLALIAYRQPVTRGDIEQIRGVAVSSDIIRTLVEREWVRIVGHRDVPGRPALYATTRQFLDYFNLRSLDELPSLADIRDLDEINAELDLKSRMADLDAGRSLGAAESDDGDYPDGLMDTVRGKPSLTVIDGSVDRAATGIAAAKNPAHE